MIALTFDDGPDPIWTGRVLSELDRRGAVATFFLDARRALAYPDSIEAIVGAGHEAGFHCLEHVRHSELSEVEVAADAAAGLAMLSSLGVRPSVWRAPWGVETAATRRVAAELGLVLCGWNRDSRDWRGDRCEEMLLGIEIEGGLCDGAVVLMHDAIGPGAGRWNCAETERLTAALLDRADERGLRPVSVSDLQASASQVLAS